MFNRLKSKSKFTLVFEKGIFFRGKDISLKVLKLNNLEDSPCEWAICVSYKIGNAIIRNKLKRICRVHIQNFYKKKNIKIPLNYYIVLLPSKNLINTKFEEREIIFENLLKKILP